MHDDLRNALRPMEPPAGFTDRVLRAAQAQPGSPKPAPLFTTWAKAAAIAATLVAATGGGLWFRAPVRLAIAAMLTIATISGGVWYRAEERRREGEEAKRQVLVSLNIAGSKLREVAMKINHEQER